jgi:cardiolipin synthase
VSEPPSTDQVLTVPNVITLVRLGLVPFFVWAFLISSDWWALGLLFVIGNSDWIDGFVARRFGQVSELGKILDPISDRVAIIAVVLAVSIRGLVPPLLSAVILGREALVAVAFGILEGKGLPRIPVNRVGKAATLAIFTGMGVTVLSVVMPIASGERVRTVAVGILIVGAALYWVATGMYFNEARKLWADRGS